MQTVQALPIEPTSDVRYNGKHTPRTSPLMLLSQIFQFCLMPLNWALLCFFLGLYLLETSRVVAAKRWLIGGLTLILVPSIAIVPYSLMGHLEKYYLSYPIDDYPQADAIVVLGGTAAQVEGPRYETEETGSSRLLPAARLFRLGKARHLITTGGGNYTDKRGIAHTQAEDMERILIDMGVPKQSILIQNKSRNTIEDVAFSTKVLQSINAHRVLLVTSACHMRRAMAATKGLPFEFIAVPTGFQITDSPLGLRSFLPEAGGLTATSEAIKEYVGYWLSDFRRDRMLKTERAAVTSGRL